MGNKWILPVGLLGGLLVLAGLGKAKAAEEEPPPEGEGAAIDIVLLDSDGNPVPISGHGKFYATVDEGFSGSLSVQITNGSTKGEIPWEAIFRVVIDGGVVGSADVITVRHDEDIPFNAGQSIIFTSPVDIAMGLGGQLGYMMISIYDPEGASVASESLDITINSIAVVYDATINPPTVG